MVIKTELAKAFCLKGLRGSDRGSTPLRSIKERSDRALVLSDLSFVVLKIDGIRSIPKIRFRFWADRSEAETDCPTTFPC